MDHIVEAGEPDWEGKILGQGSESGCREASYFGLSPREGVGRERNRKSQGKPVLIIFARLSALALAHLLNSSLFHYGAKNIKTITGI